MTHPTRPARQRLTRRASVGLTPTVRRRHEVVAHTADMGLRAAAADLPSLFEEIAVALAEVMADLDPRAVERAARTDGRGRAITLEAEDLVGLAYLWLNELLGVAQAHGEALARTEVRSVEKAPDRGAWHLDARTWLVPYSPASGGGTRPRHDVKSATYHRLTVRRQRGGWVLTAILDV